MGWNSYNCFGSAVHEDEVKGSADYMAARLKQYGWQYIVDLIFMVLHDNPPGSTIGPGSKQLDDGSYVPLASMDNMEGCCPISISFPRPLVARVLNRLATIFIHSV